MSHIVAQPRDAHLAIRLPSDMLAWIKDRAAADCRSVSSFVVKCLAEQRRFDHDDEIAAELQRELIAV